MSAQERPEAVADAPGPPPGPPTPETPVAQEVAVAAPDEAVADPADRADEPPPVACRMLRTKTFFGTYTSTGEDWQYGDSTTAVYWCLETMGTSGPDDDLAHPHSCREGRCCFKPPLE